MLRSGFGSARARNTIARAGRSRSQLGSLSTRQCRSSTKCGTILFALLRRTSLFVLATSDRLYITILRPHQPGSRSPRVLKATRSFKWNGGVFSTSTFTIFLVQLFSRSGIANIPKGSHPSISACFDCSDSLPEASLRALPRWAGISSCCGSGVRTNTGPAVAAASAMLDLIRHFVEVALRKCQFIEFACRRIRKSIFGSRGIGVRLAIVHFSR